MIQAASNKSTDLSMGKLENHSPYSCGHNNIDRIIQYNLWVLTIAMVVNLIDSGLDFGDRSQIGGRNQPCPCKSGKCSGGATERSAWIQPDVCGR
jgi:hypothetical protein